MQALPLRGIILVVILVFLDVNTILLGKHNEPMHYYIVPVSTVTDEKYIASGTKGKMFPCGNNIFTYDFMHN